MNGEEEMDVQSLTSLNFEHLWCHESHEGTSGGSMALCTPAPHQFLFDAAGILRCRLCARRFRTHSRGDGLHLAPHVPQLP